MGHIIGLAIVLATLFSAILFFVFSIEKYPVSGILIFHRGGHQMPCIILTIFGSLLFLFGIVVGKWLCECPTAVTGILFLISEGKIKMPLTLAVGKTATALLNEFDAQGNAVPPVAAPTYASDNAAVATVSGNQVTAVGAGTANISGTDSGDGITASTVLTVTDVAVTGTLTLTAN